MQKRTKGDRLNWTPISEVKPVKLTYELLQGKRVRFKKMIKTKELIHKSIREGKDLSNIDVKFCTPI